jgi:hypothetical protein
MYFLGLDFGHYPFFRLFQVIIVLFAYDDNEYTYALQLCSWRRALLSRSSVFQTKT